MLTYTLNHLNQYSTRIIQIINSFKTKFRPVDVSISMVLLTIITVALSSILCICASTIPNIEKIVGGFRVTNQSSVSYQISLQYKGGHFCGGSFIRTDVILCAAHCVYNRNVSDFAVRAGTLVRDRGGVIINVLNIIIHESYDPNSFDYDYSLIFLDKYDTTRLMMGIIQLPSSSSDVVPDNTTLFVFGWGDTFNFFENQRYLRAVYVPKFPDGTCNDTTHYDGKITERMICAGFEGGRKDSCQGDSGGPLVQQQSSGGLPVQYGVVSWGFGCAQPKRPGIYSKVSSVLDWIDNKINDENSFSKT